MEKTKVKELEKAMSIIDEMSADSKEWEMYESRRKAIINYNSSMEYARREGIKIGEEIGERRGEKRAREKTAKAFLELGVDTETIMKATGLTKEELEKLKEE